MFSQQSREKTTAVSYNSTLRTRMLTIVYLTYLCWNLVLETKQKTNIRNSNDYFQLELLQYCIWNCMSSRNAVVYSPYQEFFVNLKWKHHVIFLCGTLHRKNFNSHWSRQRLLRFGTSVSLLIMILCYNLFDFYYILSKNYLPYSESKPDCDI